MTRCSIQLTAEEIQVKAPPRYGHHLSDWQRSKSLIWLSIARETTAHGLGGCVFVCVCGGGAGTGGDLPKLSVWKMIWQPFPMFQIPTVFKRQKNVIIRNASRSQTPWFESQLWQSILFPVPGLFSSAKWYELTYLALKLVLSIMMH